MPPTPSPASRALTDVAHVSDEELAQLALGDPAYFEPLMRRHNQRLFRLTRAILGDSTEAEDAMQQAYTSAYVALAGFRASGSFAGWMTRIARNEALGRIRRRKHRREVELPPDREDDAMAHSHPTFDAPDQLADARRLAALAEEAIDALPEPYRLVFVLRELEGLDTAEAAHALDVTEEVVKVRLHRARHRLRDALRSSVEPGVLETYAFLGERCDRIVANVLQRIRGTRGG